MSVFGIPITVHTKRRWSQFHFTDYLMNPFSKRKIPRPGCIALVATVFLLWVVMLGCDSIDLSHIPQMVRDARLISEPGPILFVSDESGISQLYSMNVDGSSVKRLSNIAGYEIVEAVWSPDGKRIALAFRTNATSAVDGIFNVSSETGAFMLAERANNWGIRLIQMPDESSYYSPAHQFVWSSDSQSLIMRRHVKPHSLHIWKSSEYRLNEEAWTQVWSSYEGPPRTITDWSEDGRTLLGHVDDSMQRNSDGFHLMYTYINMWSASGDSLSALGEVEHRYQNPVWSYSEDKIAFNLLTFGEADMHVTTLNGEYLRRFTFDGYRYMYPVAWSDDDRYILARGIREENTENYEWSTVIVDVDKSTITDLTPFEGKHNEPTSWNMTNR